MTRCFFVLQPDRTDWTSERFDLTTHSGFIPASTKGCIHCVCFNSFVRIRVLKCVCVCVSVGKSMTAPLCKRQIRQESNVCGFFLVHSQRMWYNCCLVQFIVILKKKQKTVWAVKWRKRALLFCVFILLSYSLFLSLCAFPSFKWKGGIQHQ